MKNLCKKYKINNHEFKSFSKSFIKSLNSSNIENKEFKKYIDAVTDLLQNGDIFENPIQENKYKILILNSNNNQNIILLINEKDFTKASTLAVVMSNEHSNKEICKELIKLYDCYESSMISINTK